MPDILHFCGIGGSGMLPLAMIAQGLGFTVTGSDRSYDQGRTPEKFTWLQRQGIELHPQDGSGVTPDVTRVVVSTAVEDSIPDIKAAHARGIDIVHRAALLAEFFNKAETRIAIAGTSGKTTTTGMIGFMLKELGVDPTVMNGGIFRNYAKDNPYCSALVGEGGVFVTEADESDGSIALYHPTIAVLNNIALDHKPMDELIPLFRDYLAKADVAVLNFDSAEVRDLAQHFPREKIVSYAMHYEADVGPDGLILQVPGDYNISNALAALGVTKAMGIDLTEARGALTRFEGIKRRMETVGAKNNITVIDDFAHNPDKIAASLSALKQKEGRLIVFFQPHGYGFLKLLKDELAACFSKGLGAADILLMVEPYYAGGTVDRSIGSADVTAAIRGPQADIYADRNAVKEQILSIAQSGDRIVIMGARDDTLSEFAGDILRAL